MCVFKREGRIFMRPIEKSTSENTKKEKKVLLFGLKLSGNSLEVFLYHSFSFGLHWKTSWAMSKHFAF